MVAGNSRVYHRNTLECDDHIAFPGRAREVGSEEDVKRRKERRRRLLDRRRSSCDPASVSGSIPVLCLQHGDLLVIPGIVHVWLGLSTSLALIVCLSLSLGMSYPPIWCHLVVLLSGVWGSTPVVIKAVE